MQEESDGLRPFRPTAADAARQLSCAMGGIGDGSGRFDEGDLSWTNEALPLEVRRALLDKALDEFRSAKAAGKTRASADTPNRKAQTRAGPDSTSRKDKPQA
ncbi:MAG TPA: hypothetical protein VNN06_05770 [Ramlibacter sp.]|nr:hypothetical protein [Ramlibacter sp.]